MSIEALIGFIIISIAIVVFVLNNTETSDMDTTKTVSKQLLERWAVSIYNPSSITFDPAAYTKSTSLWTNFQDPKWDPSNPENPNYNPTL